MKVDSIGLISVVVCILAASSSVFAVSEGGFSADGSQFTLEAPIIERVGTTFHASGGLLMLSRHRRITASYGEYDVITQRGTLQEVTFTTCDKAKPDYHFRAREVTLRPGNRVSARRISLYVGQVRILTLPGMKFRSGEKRTTAGMFPRPSADKNGGFMIAQKLTLVDSDRLNGAADLRYSTSKGVESDICSTWGLFGNLGDLPGKVLNYDSLRKGALTMPASDIESAYWDNYVQPTGVARVHQLSRISFNQRTYDVNNTGLVVFRQPELGLEYVAPALNFTRTRLDPRLEIYPLITTMWGRYKEVPGTVGFTNRTSGGVLAAVNLLPLGRYTAVQPIVAYSAAEYNTPSTYHTWGYGVDASHLFKNGSLASLRYTQRFESGVTPFQFDNVDILQELQGAVQAQIKRHTLGFVAGLNMDSRSIYDWSVMYGYHTDCLSGSVIWSQLRQRIEFDISLLGG